MIDDGPINLGFADSLPEFVRFRAGLLPRLVYGLHEEKKTTNPPQAKSVVAYDTQQRTDL